MDQNGVSIAFDIVLEEIENAIETLNKEGAQAFQAGNYEIARDLMEKGSQMTAFRTKVKDLQKEWNNIFATISPSKPLKRSRKITARLERGLRTPEDNFRIPILQSLVELGRSAAMALDSN
jgi:serine phosphatase RsbU (regulator of sigma subunit)